MTELMDHVVAQMTEFYKGSPYADSFVIYHDALGPWWEKEAQEYLRKRGFFDRQVRAWGDTNAEYWRYYESVVGDRPEMCALDFHLFEDLDFSIQQNIINKTESLSQPTFGYDVLVGVDQDEVVEIL